MKTKVILFLFLISFSAQSQNYKFGKVSKEELLQSVDPSDSSFDAVMLYRKHHVFTDRLTGKLITEVHQRIKILNNDGLDWADQQLRLYKRYSGSKEKVQFLKGYTYNIEDNELVKYKLKSDGIFDEEADENWRIKSFSLPNVKVGSIIEFNYELISPYIEIEDINFQYSIPVKVFELKVITHAHYLYNKLLNPRAIYQPKIEFSGANGLDIVSANLQDVPALKDEPFVSNHNNYAAKLIMELSATKFPNHKIEYLESRWERVTTEIYKHPGFGRQLDEISYFKDDIDGIIYGITNPKQKITLIFDYLKSKMKWNDYYGYTCGSGVRKAYKEGLGNVGDINLMLVSMLRYAGLRANPVLVSTKNNGIPIFPTRKGFNYVICMIENDNFNMLLDASEDYGTLNILPIRVLNWQGRIVRENGSSAWIDLLPTVQSRDITSLNVNINSDLSIDGKVRQQKTDYIAMDYRNRFAKLSLDDHIKYIENDNGELVVSDVEIENNKDYKKPYKLTYNYNLVDGIEEIGDLLYFSPMLFFTSEENPFKLEERKLPIDLNYPFSDKYIINIKLPEDYAIESIPENKKVQFNDVGDFTYLVKQNDNYLQLTISLNMKTSVILAQDYKTFREFYTKVIEKQSERIVLKKAL